MRLRHIVLIRFHETTTAEEVATLTAALDGLPDRIPQIRSYQHAPSAGVRPGSWDYAIVAEFDSADDLHTYLAHPDHAAAVEAAIDPVSAERASAQVEL